MMPSTPAGLPRAAVEQSIPAHLERQVATFPDRLAVSSGERSLTYVELDRAANALARAIMVGRAPSREPVALLVEHTALAIVATLAVLKTGTPYLALDAHQPVGRLAPILAHSGATLLVCSPALSGLARALAGPGHDVLEIPAIDVAHADGAPRVPIAPTDLACICYTSGSTGEPKAVAWDHRGVLHRALTYATSLRLRPDDRLSLLPSLSVTASLKDLYGALAAGASVVLLDLQAEGLAGLGRWLEEQRITVADLPASAFRQVAGSLGRGERFRELRMLPIYSEPVFTSDVALYRAHFPDSCTLVNCFGSSEAGSLCEYHIGKSTAIDGELAPIGYPLPDKELALLDERDRPVEDGDVGEIVVRSEYLAPGYWRRPDLDRRAFLPDPSGGRARIYRTGDLARRRADGCLIHLGRKDGRTKLGGRFIDPVEVEARLLAHPGLEGAVVTVREDRPGDARLVAYVRPSARPAPTIAELRAFVRSTLADHLIPAAWVVVEAWPRTPLGKIDRLALPAPGRGRPALGHAAIPPRSPVEEALARIWADALDLDAVGVADDFLELGGTSLVAARVIARVERAFGMAVPASTLLGASCVADMASVIVARLLEGAGPEQVEGWLAEPRGAAPAGDGAGPSS